MKKETPEEKALFAVCGVVVITTIAGLITLALVYPGHEFYDVLKDLGGFIGSLITLMSVAIVAWGIFRQTQAMERQTEQMLDAEERRRRHDVATIAFRSLEITKTSGQLINISFNAMIRNGAWRQRGGLPINLASLVRVCEQSIDRMTRSMTK